MAVYAVEMRRTSSTTLEVGTITADATRPRRGSLLYFSFGSEATPADQTCHLRVSRVTAAGTSTAVTPVALNPADAATETDAGENHTIAATTTANSELLSAASHFRATYQWFANPAYGIFWPATASNGIGVATPVSTALQVVIAMAHFR
jgi:hypothetical protein